MGIRLNIIISVILHVAAVVVFFAAGDTGGIQHENRVITVDLIEERPEIQKAASLNQGSDEVSNVIKPAETRAVLEKENVAERAEKTFESEPVLMTSHEAARPAVISAVHYEKAVQSINYDAGISRSLANSPNYDYDSSRDFETIRSAIEKVKRYPVLARKRGIEGTVHIGFRINRLGEPENLEIIKGSGSSILDNATIAIVKKAAPFPGVDSSVEIPVVFKLTE